MTTSIFRPITLFTRGILLAGLASFTLQDNPGKPDESRFTSVVVASDLDEPMMFDVLRDGTAYIIERKGGLKKYDPSSNTTTLIAEIPVNTKYTSAQGVVSEAEEGLMGLSLDPGFEKNHWIYLYYAHPTEKKHILSRWTLEDDQLKEGSEKRVLEVETQREVCCHTGGGMTWDKAGNLFLTVGNNTGNQQAAQTDERPGRSSWDDQGHAGNTNDLRGKILRIHPEADGSYTIPEGNLYPKGTAKTRPEIYSMGHRNPWRIFVDSKTGYVYWGEVGPDASEDSEIGPRGYDEMNQGKKPANYGWPWFVGDNQAFPVYDYATNKPLAKKDPAHLVNESPNNTGLKELYPAQPAFISYPYGVSEKFPLVGSGARSATGGPVYRRADFKNPKRPWPAYYEGKWLTADFSRGWIMAVSMDENSDYMGMERVLPGYKPVQPIDIKFGPDGDLYLLEYGSNWFRKSDNSRLTRIEYNGGNRRPQVEVAASNTGGTVPFKVTLQSEGTKDFDGDALKYQWKVTSPGVAPQAFATANPVVTFSKPGVYTATLTVTDPKGAKNSKSVKIIAGNEPPQVAVKLQGNQSFFFKDQPIGYAVEVADKEDGSLTNGKIRPESVAMSIDYTSQGFDYAEVIQAQRSVDATTKFAVAQTLISQSDCKVCHQVDTKSVGPMFTEIAKKYKDKEGSENYLIQKIRNGGSGVWGEVTMAAHPNMSVTDAGVIVKYILSINEKTLSSLPLEGSYAVKIPEGDNGKGSVLVRAAYTDRGASGAKIPNQTVEKMIVLRSPVVDVSDAKVIKGVDFKAKGYAGAGFTAVPYPNTYFAMKNVDLTNIKQLEVDASAQKRDGSSGGVIEVRVDSPTGDLLGSYTVEKAPEVDIAKLMAEMESEKKNEKPGAKKKQPVNPFARPPIHVNLKPTNGFHDVYFVFKNEKVKAIQPLMTLSTVTFQDASSKE